MKSFKEYIIELSEEMSDKKNTLKLIAYFKSILNVPMPASSRGGPHLRTAVDGPFDQILNNVAKIKIELMAKSISGSFPTYKITLLQKIGSIPVGTTMLYVNSKSSTGIVNNKEFTPDALGFAGKKYNEKQLKEALLKAIKNHPKFLKVGSFMMSLIDSSYKNLKTVEYGDTVSSSDISKIAKDFGELTGALWLLKTKYKGTDNKVYFPFASNEPLIDYIIETKNGNKKISAKAGKGAPPSINVVAQELKSGNIKLNSTEKKYAKVIIDISDNSTIDGIIEASKSYNTPGYAAISKIIPKVDRYNIENYLNKFTDWSIAKSKLESFFNATKRNVSEMIWKRIYEGENQMQRKDGIIISPLGYHLVDELNKDKGLTDLLNKVLSSLTVEQLYLNTNGKTVSYDLVAFKDGKFVFDYNANAGNPSLKKISFKMKV
jgi:hypothetical protein